MPQTKYIFITGGVISGLGKGISAASLGYLLKESGYTVTLQKFDPYLNIDPGTMSPYQHGEVYVTDDGSETDLDLGHYERFLDQDMTALNNSTTGQIYYEVIKKERKGDYLGATVQIIPHITDEIIRRFTAITEQGDYDFILTEVGGTIGDIESLPFLEAIRQFELNLGPENCLNIHVTMLPFIKSTGEIKTKPTQHSVMKLREIGLQPDVIICRTEKPMLDRSIRQKIGLFCNVKADWVIEAWDADTIYEVPLILQRQSILGIIEKKFQLTAPKALDTIALKNFVSTIKYPSYETNIAVVGKYTGLHDAYKSIIESFNHAGVENDCHVNVRWIEAEDLESSNFDHTVEYLQKIDGILIPGGFGERGIEGKLAAIRFARENNVPFLGICLGLQTAIIEYARNVLGLEEANSTEFNEETPDPVIHIMPEQVKVLQKGGTMRLGAYRCDLVKNSKAAEAYQAETVFERHRHRFEVNNHYRQQFIENGILISGVNPELDLVEIIEIPQHPWFVAVQFHPELKSRINKAHPLFREFVRASLKRRKELHP
jgi:CTP synthase